MPDDLVFDIDLDRAVDELRRVFPGVCLWWGEYTGSIWALLPDRLVEAKNARDLAVGIRSLLEHDARSVECPGERPRSAAVSAVPPRVLPRRRRTPRAAPRRGRGLAGRALAWAFALFG
ncbi:hypothetical protein DMH08_06000 [Actinomadura sp. WAC 06369]|nr:hypothetical protein DMH08_06000 [Actinomadura sp. WAC 06369]